MSVSVCLCVCLVRQHIFGNARAVIVKLLYAFNYGRRSVLFLRRCDTLCTSGFMDDVIWRHADTVAATDVVASSCAR